VKEHAGKEDLQQEIEGIETQRKGKSEVRVLACATGQMAGLHILRLDVCVKRHQKSKLKPRSEDRSFANAPASASLLYCV
jgi:hypothetical protein